MNYYILSKKYLLMVWLLRVNIGRVYVGGIRNKSKMEINF